MKPIELLSNPKRAGCKYTIGVASHYSCEFDITRASCGECCTVEDWEECPYNDKRFKET